MTDFPLAGQTTPWRDQLKAYIDERPMPGNRVALLGDSNTTNGIAPFDAGSGTWVSLSDSWWNWVQAYAHQSLVLAHNGGVGGDTTAMMRARVGDVVASRPDICAVMGGTNDLLASRPLTDIIADLTAIYEQLRTAGILVVAMEILPSSRFNSVTVLAKQFAVNNFIAEYARAHPGIVPVRVAADVADPTSGLANTDLFRNEGGQYVHLRVGAAARIGRRVWEALKPFVSVFDLALSNNADPRNAIRNGLMLGDVSGVATNWTISTADGAVYTASKTTRDDMPGSWQKVVLESGTINIDTVVPMASNVAWSSVNQTLTGEMEIRGDATNLTHLSLTVQAENAQGGSFRRVVGMFDAYASSKIAPIPAALIRTQTMAAGYNASTTHARLRLTLRGAGTIELSRAAIRVG